MKLRFLHAAFLLIFIIAFLAGCSSSSPSSGTKTSSSGVMPWEVGTPVPYTQLSQLVLSRAEMPFVPVAWMNQTPDMSEPEFAQFGAIRGYKQISINEKEESATSEQLGQLIVEYPPENAALAIRAFEYENLNADQSRYKITWLADPKIGDQSCALEVIDSTGGTKPIAMVVFTKSNIMESVVMVAQKPDTDALIRSARMAAVKIP